MRGWGLLLIMAGLMQLIWAAVSDPTVASAGLDGVEQRTYNLGLLQYQLMAWQSGLALIVSGCVLIGSSAVRKALIAHSFSDAQMPASEVRRSDEPVVAAPQEAPADQMSRYGIAQEGEYFTFQGYRYTNLVDAVNYARLQEEKG